MLEDKVYRMDRLGVFSEGGCPCPSGSISELEALVLYIRASAGPTAQYHYHATPSASQPRRGMLVPHPVSNQFLTIFRLPVAQALWAQWSSTNFFWRATVFEREPALFE